MILQIVKFKHKKQGKQNNIRVCQPNSLRITIKLKERKNTKERETKM